jgi:hypothetical protein
VLSFNEGKTCDAVIRHLEQRHNERRSNVTPHDNHPDHGRRIELTVEFGSVLYAIEHTGIEPFEHFMRLNGEGPRLIDPIVQAASHRLPRNEILHLHIPIGCLFGKPRNELRRIQQALVDFVVASSPQLPLRAYGDTRRPHAATPIAPNGVPFAVTLYRFRPAPTVPVAFNFMITNDLPLNSDELRATRMRAACDKKFSKLAAWKSDANARTILILEDNDIQLTNQAIVTNNYVPIARGRPDRPDETYLLVTVAEPWWLCPILIDDNTYFDFAESDEKSLFEYPSDTLDSITLR